MALHGAVSVTGSYCRWDEGPAVALFSAGWVCQPAAEGAAQRPHGLTQMVRGIVPDGSQLG